MITDVAMSSSERLREQQIERGERCAWCVTEAPVAGRLGSFPLCSECLAELTTPSFGDRS